MTNEAKIRRKRAIRNAITKRWRAKHPDQWKAYMRSYRKRPNAIATYKAYVERNRYKINARRREIAATERAAKKSARHAVEIAAMADPHRAIEFT